MTDGRFDMQDIANMMMGGGLEEPEAQGRIVTLDEGRQMFVGLPTKNSILKQGTVYEILSDSTGKMWLEERGESHIDWEHSRSDLTTELLTQSNKLILTKEEMRKHQEVG